MVWNMKFDEKARGHIASSIWTASGANCFLFWNVCAAGEGFGRHLLHLLHHFDTRKSVCGRTRLARQPSFNPVDVHTYFHEARYLKVPPVQADWGLNQLDKRESPLCANCPCNWLWFWQSLGEHYCRANKMANLRFPRNVYVYFREGCYLTIPPVRADWMLSTAIPASIR